MFYFFLGLLIIAFGIIYTVYQIYYKTRNSHAKLIFEEVKRRVKAGEKKEAYLELLDDEGYKRNYYELIKSSKLTKEELVELSGAAQRDRSEKKSGVRGVARLSMRLGKIIAITGAIITFCICRKINQTVLYSFIFTIIAGQLTYFFVILLIETIREYIKRRAEKI